jgi:hypothetical protein
MHQAVDVRYGTDWERHTADGECEIMLLFMSGSSRRTFMDMLGLMDAVPLHNKGPPLKQYWHAYAHTGLYISMP